jgi:hypothetical protein
VLTFHEGRTRDTAALSAKKSWQPITAGVRDWRLQMAGRDVLEFEAVAAPLLDELGYERAAGGIDEALARRAANARTAFAQHLRRWRRPVPEWWQRVAA